MRNRTSPLPQVGLWLLVACLVATAFALLPLLKEIPRAPGLDFYHYWGVAHARPQMPLTQSNPYRFPHEYKQTLARLAATSGDSQLQAVQAAKSALDLTNTPLLYALAAVLPANYSAALALHRALQIACVIISALLLLRLCRRGSSWYLAGWGLILAAYGPLVIDLLIANIASLQLAGILAALGLARVTPRLPIAGLLNALWLPLLTLIKPNFALVTGILWIATLRGLPSALTLPALLATVIGAALGVEIGSHYFASPVIWIDWLRVLLGPAERLAYDYELGNYSSALLLTRTAGGDLRGVSLALLATLATLIIVLPWGLTRRLLKPAPLFPAADTAFEWASIGTVLTLASAPLVWTHYYVLALIPVVYLVGERRGAPSVRVMGVLGLLCAAGSVHLLALAVRGPEWPPLRVLDCLSWLPLALGLTYARITLRRR